MQKRSILIAAACALLVLCATYPVRSASRPEDIPFEKHTIDLGASETAVFADINRDGKLDWSPANTGTKPRDGRSTNSARSTTPTITSTISSTLPLDVDGDGYVDIVSCSWFARN